MAGATAIFESNPFERRFRDMHAVSQQSQSQLSIFEAIGRHFLGLPHRVAADLTTRQILHWSMIFSENRFPLFRIML